MSQKLIIESFKNKGYLTHQQLIDTYNNNYYMYLSFKEFIKIIH